MALCDINQWRNICRAFDDADRPSSDQLPCAAFMESSNPRRADDHFGYHQHVGNRNVDLTVDIAARQMQLVTGPPSYSTSGDPDMATGLELCDVDRVADLLVLETHDANISFLQESLEGVVGRRVGLGQHDEIHDAAIKIFAIMMPASEPIICSM
jgi:hypothetical protein